MNENDSEYVSAWVQVLITKEQAAKGPELLALKCANAAASLQQELEDHITARGWKYLQ